MKIWLLKNFAGYAIPLIGFFMVILFTRHSGIGISPDSIVYLSVARNTITQGLFVDYNLQPLVDFPVGYPFFLTVAGLITRVELINLAPYLNGFLFAACIMITGRLIDSFELVRPWYKWFILFSMALSPALLGIFTMLWSETLFILLTLLFIAVLQKYLLKYATIYLIIAACIAGVSCITRYAGITVIGTGLMILLFDTVLKPKRKITHLFLFSIVSLSILIVNLVHNALVTGYATGPREAGITSLQTNIGYYADVVCSWFYFPAQQTLLYSFFVVLLLMMMVFLFFRSVIYTKQVNNTMHILRAFFIIYTVFIIGISTLSHFEQINTRLLSPIFIPLLLIATGWMPGVIEMLKTEKRQIVLVMVSLAALIFQYCQFNTLKSNYHENNTYGIPGYTDDSWRNSEIVKFIKKHQSVFDKNYGLYSNAHEAVYFNAGLRSSSIPHKIDKADIYDFYHSDGFYVIWFDHVSDTELISLAEISRHSKTVRKYAFKDGAIYFVRPLNKLVNL